MAESDTGIVLKKTSVFRPIVLFPYYKDSHTIEHTGRRWISDVKLSVGFARLYLNDEALYCKIILPSLLILEIHLSDITDVTILEGKEEILEIRFKRARKGLLTRFALSGEPRMPQDRVLLNLGSDSKTWCLELRKRISKEVS